jgi:hypothetical protein
MWNGVGPRLEATRRHPMSVQPDHELEVLEDDQNVPPRPEEQIADLRDAPDAGFAEPPPEPDPEP